ncbi:MAG TPA: M20/M25/M40 family metallo-hydrolase [Candidatus Acidoferrales bacterium]|jgi:acetylornithine deacetylase|nr:M20/M25/M40 family metallo-hydrolase [Candidatus Acidoferrales bacterium]
MHPFELTRALVDLESITENEKAVGEYLLRYLSALALRTGGAAEAMVVTPERFNVYAEWGTPTVVLSTHMDTVPPFFPSSEDDENIYGRGTCDAKGIIAAMIAAAEKLIETGTRNFGLLFVVGEERNSAGAEVASRSPRGARYLINGEPTESKVALGSKGILRYEIIAKGKMAHSAYPELGDSAIEKLLDALGAIRGVRLPEDPVLGKTTLNIGTISGGRAPNIIPDTAKAELAVRLVCDGRIVDQALRDAVGARAEIREILSLPAMHFQALDGFSTSVVAFTTDIPVLVPAWGEPFLFGPGSIHVAHTTQEKISKQELLAAVETYAQMTRTLLGKAEAHHA